jgi:2-oxoglutarate ferredoxin oxidoreductase subunit beta
MQLVHEKDELVTGIIFEDPDSVPYEDRAPGYSREPLATQDYHLDEKLWEKILTTVE